MQIYKECPQCGKEMVLYKIDHDKLSLKNPMKLRKQIKKMMKNPSEDTLMKIYPCRYCGAIPEEYIENGVAECGECSFKTSDEEEMLKHFHEEHGHVTSLSEKSDDDEG